MNIVKGLIVVEHDDKALVIDIKSYGVGVSVEPTPIAPEKEFNATMIKLYRDLEIWAKKKQEHYTKRNEKAD